MSHGGVRTGAGRPKGRATNLADKARKEALSGGTSPLEYLLGVMRDIRQDDARRLDAAKAAAPYVHAKLNAMTLTGKDGGPVEIVTKAQRDAAVNAALRADT